MTEEEHYRDIAIHALAGFQLIEVVLKDYIADYHDKVREFLPVDMVYEHKADEVTNAPLGKLLDIFGKINANKQLVVELRNLQSKRNDLAHRALVKLYWPAKNEFDFSGNSTQLDGLADDLGGLIEQIIVEHAKLFQIARE
ncbi:hypothetical protein WAE56_11100 [Iodobacter sp. LRB]|uniref:hypothetical protein n=1 Tax=unclassified Iodobacter TaxID=235634 RepID=UPI00117B52C4|nr:hypothetical protein [Iodobacter sp. BJB302]